MYFQSFQELHGLFYEDWNKQSILLGIYKVQPILDIYGYALLCHSY